MAHNSRESKGNWQKSFEAHSENTADAHSASARAGACARSTVVELLRQEVARNEPAISPRGMVDREVMWIRNFKDERVCRKPHRPLLGARQVALEVADRIVRERLLPLGRVRARQADEVQQTRAGLR